jgi:glycerophosphoryl diester phosphodiesterase
MNTPKIVCHKANHESHSHPPNTLEAVQACLAAKVDWIEVDVQALQDGEDYLMVHDDTLEHETSGSGVVGECSLEEARKLRIKGKPDYAPGLLSNLIPLLQDDQHKPCVQLDFKSFFLFPTDEPLGRFVDMLKPLASQIHVSSPADWQLRKLKQMAPWMDIGFDIEFHFDLRQPDEHYDPRQPPYREGAYGYHDDSLLSMGIIWPEVDYLADRCTVLLNQVPGISTLHVNHHLMAHSLDVGFNWAEAAHARGVALSTWTLDADNPAAVKYAPRLRDAGVDRFTSNTPAALEKMLNP